MMVLPIYHFQQNLVLKRKAKKVSRIDGSIQRLIDNMIETVKWAKGVGLAAPQIGVSLRVIVVQMPGNEPIVLINPEIVKRSGKQEVTEACLSVPGYYGEIVRSAGVTVKGKDRNGKVIRIKARGLMAEALEHEIDHLNGTLYVDRIKVADKLHKVEYPVTRSQQVA
jgi:peptide deformylase